MSKVVICGIQKSGKTCYFYGMLRSMMMGKAGFTLAARNEDFNKLRLPIRRLSDTSLPLDERFPDPSTKIDKYMLELLYHQKRVESIDWTDYPGEFVEKADSGFISLLDDAQALLICVDGSFIQGSVDDVENIRYQLSFDKGGLELNHALGQAALKHTGPGPKLPPICVMVTKYDKVSKELKKKEILIDEIIKPLFSSAFETENVPIAICPVSLGVDIETGGKLDPRNVEKPILFAMYWSRRRDYNDNINNLLNIKDTYETEVEEYNSKSFLRRLITPKPGIPLTEKDLEERKRVLTQYKNDCNAMLDNIGNTFLYEGGEEKDWEDYRL